MEFYDCKYTLGDRWYSNAIKPKQIAMKKGRQVAPSG